MRQVPHLLRLGAPTTNHELPRSSCRTTHHTTPSSSSSLPPLSRSLPRLLFCSPARPPTAPRPQKRQSEQKENDVTTMMLAQHYLVLRQSSRQFGRSAADVVAGGRHGRSSTVVASLNSMTLNTTTHRQGGATGTTRQFSVREYPEANPLARNIKTAFNLVDPTALMGQDGLALTKIVATIGPTSEQREPLQKVAQSGMKVMRLNFSHATQDEVELRLENLALCQVRVVIVPPSCVCVSMSVRCKCDV